MKLQRLVLETFRNHEQTIIDCSMGVNLFLGDNGEGKTNILEGISYLCLSKSFYAVNDTVVMNVNKNRFSTTGNFLSDGNIFYEVQVTFDRLQNQKKITVNKAKIEKASLLIGRFPVVILSPEQSSITMGSPSNRRSFVDFVISQSSRTYLECLIDYRRIVKQRNKILSDMLLSRKENNAAVEPWNESLIRVGAILIRKRIEFIEDFQSIVINSYATLAGTAEQPEITYLPSFECAASDRETIETIFRQALQDHYQEECRIGYSLVGPHRDEFIIQINKLDARNYASQGQHKTLLVALKLAEFFYLKERCSETPILLFDDILSEIDERRSQRLLETIAELGQVFVTSTDERALNWMPVVSSNPRKFFIKQGKVDRVEDAVFIR
ncbi:MAG: DNA replication/repair protein RecF [Bacteroidota bacterium]